MGRVVSHGSYLAWNSAERLNCDSCDLVMAMIGEGGKTGCAAPRIELIGGHDSTDVLLLSREILVSGSCQGAFHRNV